MRDGFRGWLESQPIKPRTQNTLFSDAKRVESAYGDLDAAYQNDRFVSILATLQYSAQDQLNARPNPSRLKAKSSAKLSKLFPAYRRALKYYSEFLQSEASGRLVPEVSALHGVGSKFAAAEVVSARTTPQTIGGAVASAELSLSATIPEVSLSVTIPDQSLAPVRVEERNGTIALVSDRGSALNASEQDFNGWREPILDHIQELLSGDFRQGTNHSRARDRLLALGDLLAGSIAELKERQFRIGYEIERLEGLISAYRSGGDDMPALNAAVLEDLDRLRIALAIGIDKLERWAEFRRAAANDPMHEGSANPGVIGDALNNMAAEMERQPTYFDPEVPATFRFLAEAAKDPQGATKTVVYGAVKSGENLLSFLGQRALRIGIKAMDGVEKVISAAVATSLTICLADAALSISGALPTHWAWLKPLLDALAKAGRK